MSLVKLLNYQSYSIKLTIFLNSSLVSTQLFFKPPVEEICILIFVSFHLGSYPLDCVKMQHRIAREAEAVIFHRKVFLFVVIIHFKMYSSFILFVTFLGICGSSCVSDLMVFQ